MVAKYVNLVDTQVVTRQIDIILEEMCRRVGITLNDINTKEDKWYTKYSWTKEEEESFAEWFANYLYTHKKARLELYNSTIRRNMIYWRNTAVWFCLQYGWSLKDK